MDLRIADFGLSEFLPKDGTLLERRCGSPGYSAPEMLKGLGYNEKSDIFSIGSILFNILTGRALFPGRDLNKILQLNRNCNLAYSLKAFEDIPP